MTGISFDADKHANTLSERGLDFLDAQRVFAGATFTFEDKRRDYSEARQISVGFPDGRMVVIGWVERAQSRHVFSMRKANEREVRTYQKQFAQA